MTDDNRLPVFISWSGPQAKVVAEELKLTLQTAIHNTRPFFSADIEAGQRWSEAIRRALEDADYGIIVATPANRLKPWLHFEAGAISKLQDSRASVLLVGMSATDLEPPLSQFQATEASDESGLRKLFGQINDRTAARGHRPLDYPALTKMLDRFLPDLSEVIAESVPDASEAAVAAPRGRDNDEKIDELLSIVRRLERPVVLGPISGGIQLSPVGEWAKRTAIEAVASNEGFLSLQRFIHTTPEDHDWGSLRSALNREARRPNQSPERSDRARMLVDSIDQIESGRP